MSTVSLDTPLALPNGQVLPGRFMKAALSEAMADPGGVPGERLERLYGTWGQGGYGLIVTGNVMVDRRHIGEPGNVVVEDEAALPALRRWAEAARGDGARVWMQINHPGRQANPLATAAHPVAPSSIGLSIPGAPTPRELTSREVSLIVDRFVRTAQVAESAGFDGVQIHGAHGYLVAQFLSPLANRRDDAWGGDAERRRRFVLEIVRGIRARVDPAFAVGIKMNSADFQRGGFSEDESRAVIAALQDEGVDLIEISGGSYESPAMMGAGRSRDSTRSREAYFLEYARTARSVAARTPLAVTGGFRSRAAMAEALAAGACDLIGLGRPAATDPAGPLEIADGRTPRLSSHRVRTPVPAPVRRRADLRALDGMLDLNWHTDQLHRMGAGRRPDAARSVWRTVGSAIKRNGIDSLRRKRG